MLTTADSQVLSDVVALGRMLGDPTHDLAILAEGNASTTADEDTFWVKASGFSMREIGPEGFVRVRFAPIMERLKEGELDDQGVRQLLAESRADETPLMPSVETFMHAYLLGLPDVAFVGHTHPTPVVSLLSVEGAEELARQRLFPDEIVCCGPAAAFVPYVDPGLPLARAIASSVERFVEEYGTVPKTIWLQNHGLIALGRSVREIESAMLMSIKAARVWLGSLGSGLRPNPLSREAVERIHHRPDEHYRQKMLWQMQHRR